MSAVASSGANSRARYVASSWPHWNTKRLRALDETATRVDGRVDLTEDASETWTDEEIAELVEDWPDCFVALMVGQPPEPDPEAIQTERVVERADGSEPECGVGEKQRNVRKGHALPA